jgi:hypothetical protein
MPAGDAQALMQANLVGQFDVQQAVQGAVVETLVHDRAAQAQGFPGQQAGARLKAETAGEAGAGAREEDAVLRQPLQVLPAAR